MSTNQTLLTNYSPDPRIRGLLGGPVGFGEINTFLPNNPQVVGPPFGAKSNPWTIMNGQSPQSIEGAMDDNASSRNVENGLVSQYVARPFANKDHLFITTGDIVFGLRSKTQQTGPITMLNLGSLNVILRQGYQENLVRYQELKETFKEEYANVRHLSESDLFGTRWYDYWKSTFNDNQLGPELSHGGINEYNDSSDDDDMTGNFTTRNNEGDGVILSNEKRRVRIVANITNEVVKEINEVLSLKSPSYRMNPAGNAFDRLINSNLQKLKEESIAEHKSFVKSYKFWMEKKDLMTGGLRFLHAGSIMDHWNFLGIVRSSTNDSGYVNNLTNGAGGKGTAVATTICKKTFTMSNYFSNTMDIGDKCFLILTRSDTGEFQYYPFSKGKENPTYDDVKYIDMSGKIATAPVIYLGRLSESLDGKIRPQGQRITACGLKNGQKSIEAYNAAVCLDKLTAHVRIK